MIVVGGNHYRRLRWSIVRWSIVEFSLSLADELFSHFLQFSDERCNAVSLFDAQTFQTFEAKSTREQSGSDHKSLRQIGSIGEI